MAGAAEVSADLIYSAIEEELRGSVRAMLAERCTPAAVLARTATDEPVDPKLWRVLARDMGLTGLAVPEEHGGAGASFREAAVVLEELGRAVAPVPYLGSAVVATATLLACEAFPLLSGERSFALALPFGAFTAAPVTDSVTGVADALTADVLLVPRADALYAVPATEAIRTPVTSLDETRRLCDITFPSGVRGDVVARGDEAVAAVRAGWIAGAALLASEQLGVAQWCLDTTVAYVRDRYQFGRPVGSFQAVKHRLAEVWVSVAQARAVARYAASCVASGDPDAELAASLAQAHCGPVAVTAAEACIQLHGGIGFTWEHPAHLYLKRAKASALAFGPADRHRARLGELVDLPLS
jgi:alkylation response protein AidB-like acyl-CoA dehydrogenase